jgi:putative two-component system response regulator
MRLIDTTARRILVVDDDPMVGSALEHILKHEGYQVVRARDGRSALSAVAAERLDLILLDLNMPNMGGFEVCKRVKGDPATSLLPIVIVTGESEFDAKMRAWDVGADDFLTKPFQVVEVLARCRSLLRTKQLVDELDSAQSVLFAFARTLEAKSRYTQGHSERVTIHALDLADRVGLTAAEKEVLRRGAMLHDIGKISTPDSILDKPARLTSEEYTIVKQHPAEGVRMVESLRSIRDVIPFIRWHHERMDGRGYPDGIFGGSIPLGVRILSVADVFDALATERPYRPALDRNECYRIMRADATGGGLDPEMVEAFCATPSTTVIPMPHPDPTAV